MNQTPVNQNRDRRWCALTGLPYLLAGWSCLSVLQASASDIPPLSTLATTLGPVLLLLAVVHVLIRLVCPSRMLADLLTLVFVSFIGLHGPISAIFTMGHRTLDKRLFLMVWSFVHTAAVVGLFIALKNRKLVQQAASAAAIALTLMLCLQVINVAIPFISDSSQISDLARTVQDTAPLDLTKSLVSPDQPSGEVAPDIYYLIVDAYARQDVLSEIYDFDNRSFIEALQSRGFWVGAESRSNYNFTEYSLASSLNMRHLEGLGLKDFQTRMPLRHLVRNSSVARLLKTSGYQTYAVETGKSETECDNFDHYSNFGKALNDYQDVLFHGTPLPRLLEWTGLTRSAARRHGDRVLFAMDEVPKLAARSNDPAFVFCHMLAPHPPFLFDSEGNEVESYGHYLLSDCRNFTSCHGYDMEAYRKGYRQQLAYINDQLIEMIDRIQASSREAVIILQADHGPRLGYGFEHEGPATCPWRFRECMSILNAISMPSDIKPEFYPSMTPVNTFRLVFNELFGTQLPTEPDESYAVQGAELARVTKLALPLEPQVEGLADNTDLQTQDLTPISLTNRPSVD